MQLYSSAWGWRGEPSQTRRVGVRSATRGGGQSGEFQTEQDAPKGGGRVTAGNQGSMMAPGAGVRRVAQPQRPATGKQAGAGGSGGDPGRCVARAQTRGSGWPVQAAAGMGLGGGPGGSGGPGGGGSRPRVLEWGFSWGWGQGRPQYCGLENQPGLPPHPSPPRRRGRQGGCLWSPQSERLPAMPCVRPPRPGQGCLCPGDQPVPLLFLEVALEEHPSPSGTLYHMILWI